MLIPDRIAVDGDQVVPAVRAVPVDRLPELAKKIRDFLVDNVCRTGGHLGSNLGAVELTIALHRVFDSPRDLICFDTGHQTYVHKILTGRAGGFASLRQRGGLSGYPSRDESAHDVIENSHASTALSYADGLARAFALSGRERHVVAVVGDGALTGGMCWEALNNIASAGHRRLVIVLNDNGRSYSPTVGGVAEHLASIRRGAHRRSNTLFSELGLVYLGPVDGHDVAAVEDALRRAREIAGPVVVHCVTVKGRGYRPAEADQADHLHGVGVVDPATGKATSPAKPTMTSVFAEEICAIGAERPDVVCLTAAMPGPTGLAAFGERFPGRLIDVGIAEQHAICSAAGLATGGLHPVVALYATFLNRAYDQLLMDVALHRLPVTFVLDRAGITGPDGPSHHGMWDTAIMATVPGLRLAAPRDPARLRELLREAVATADAPTAVRFAKATAGPDIAAVGRRMDGMDILFRGRRKALDVLGVAIGATAAAWLEAAADLDAMGIGVTVVDPRWAIPVNPALVHLAARHQLVVTAEDCGRTGGAGTLLAQSCADACISVPVRNVGIPRAFIEHGSRAELLDAVGLSAAGIAAFVRDLAVHMGILPSAALGSGS